MSAPTEAAVTSLTVEQRKIVASPQAKAEPALALAAIATDMTFAQFVVMLEAVASRPNGGALALALAGSPRVGADVMPAQANGWPNHAQIYAARREAMTRGREQ